LIPWAILTLALTIAQISTVLLEPRVWTLPYLTVQGFRHVKCSQERLASANTPERLRIFLKERPHVGPLNFTCPLSARSLLALSRETAP
jgi:hypothetical protein